MTQAAMTHDAQRLSILDAVKQLAGRPFTVHDIVAKTGLPPYQVESSLSAVIRDYESDVDVDEDGNLIYHVAAGFKARPDIVKADEARRRRARLKNFFISFFKAWTVAMVIIYFIIYVTLLFAMMVAASNRDGDSRSSPFGGGRGGGNFFFWFTRSPSGYGGYHSYRSSRERRRYQQKLEQDLRQGADPYGRGTPKALKKPSLAERTWFHLFGTAGIKRNPLEQEKELLTYIRAKRGFITNADIIALLGVNYEEADAIGTRLVATYEGEIDFTDEGASIYRFPNLMLTGAPEVNEQLPRLGYLWQIRAEEENLRNSPTYLIPTLNILNIFLAFVAGMGAMEVFEWHGEMVFFSLVGFPLIFSLIFLGLGIRRKVKDMRQAKQYRLDSLRIAIFQKLFYDRRAVNPARDAASLSRMGLGEWSAAEVAKALPTIASEVQGEIDTNGNLIAPLLWKEMAEVDKARKFSSNKSVGRTIFSSRFDAANDTPDTDSSDDALQDEIAALEKELGA